MYRLVAGRPRTLPLAGQGDAAFRAFEVEGGVAIDTSFPGLAVALVFVPAAGFAAVLPPCPEFGLGVGDFAGELLDIDGITGGFNFQAAWTTGWLAGRAMAATAPA